MARTVGGQKFGRAPRTQTIKTTDLFRITSTQNQEDNNITYQNLLNSIDSNISGNKFRAIQTANSNYVMSGDEDLILADSTSGAFSIFLPSVTAVDNGYSFTVKKVNGTNNDVTLSPFGSQTIDGGSSAALTGLNLPFITVVNDGTEWWIIN